MEYTTDNLSLQLESILDNFVYSEEYNGELNDDESEVYSFFRLLSSGNTEEEFLIISKIINKLFNEEISILDILIFFSNKNLNFSFHNMELFLESFDIDTCVLEKKEELYSFLKEYSIYSFDNENLGNFFSHFTKKYSSLSNSVFFHISKLKDNFLYFKDFLHNSKKWLITPKLNYYSKNSFKNFREAEEEYFKVLDSFSISNESLKTNTGKYIFNKIFFKNNIKTKKINNFFYIDGSLMKRHLREPILLNKLTSKNEYFNNSNWNKLFISIMKNSCFKISLIDIEKCLNKLIVEIVNNNINVTLEYFKENINFIFLNDSLKIIERELNQEKNFFFNDDITFNLFLSLLKEFLKNEKKDLWNGENGYQKKLEKDFNFLKINIENFLKKILENENFIGGE